MRIENPHRFTGLWSDIVRRGTTGEPRKQDIILVSAETREELYHSGRAKIKEKINEESYLAVICDGSDGNVSFD